MEEGVSEGLEVTMTCDPNNPGISMFAPFNWLDSSLVIMGVVLVVIWRKRFVLDGGGNINPGVVVDAGG
jgi:hypothetical protein